MSEPSNDETKTLPILQLSEEWGLDPRLVQNLLKRGCQDFFPVQRDVIPRLLRQNATSCITPQDLCVSAPTGSGKTLSFSIPLIQTLLNETTRRLRALILLPSRELALQVFSVLSDLTNGLPIIVELSTGSRSLMEEQKMLVGYVPKLAKLNGENWDMLQGEVVSYDDMKQMKGNCSDMDVEGEETEAEEMKIQKYKKEIENQVFHKIVNNNGPLRFGCSECDILVSTPGRLLDHLQFTAGFTLSHLRFLVLDEADRLLGAAYHGWVRALLRSTDDTRSSHFRLTASDEASAAAAGSLSVFKRRRLLETDEFRLTGDIHELADAHAELKLPIQRLLFSATLTDDPSALALLGIHSPLFIHSRAAHSSVTASDSLAVALSGKDTDGHHDSESSDSSDEDEDMEDEMLSDVDSDAGEESNDIIPWDDSFSLPDSLSERKLVVDTQKRLPALLAILVAAFHGAQTTYAAPRKLNVADKTDDFTGTLSMQGSVCIIFVHAVETSRRLAALLKAVNGQLKDSEFTEEHKLLREKLGLVGISTPLFNGRVEEMSRLVSASERERILKGTMDGKVSVLVASDRLARGIDLPTLRLVINYDAPQQTKNYVHRAGRTARGANGTGMCLTLLKRGQLSNFKRMRSVIRLDSDEVAAAAAAAAAMAAGKRLPTDPFERRIRNAHVCRYLQDAVEPLYNVSLERVSSML